MMYHNIIPQNKMKYRILWKEKYGKVCVKNYVG